MGVDFFGSRSGPLWLEKLVWLFPNDLHSVPSFTLSRISHGRKNCKPGVPHHELTGPSVPAQVTWSEFASTRR